MGGLYRSIGIVLLLFFCSLSQGQTPGPDAPEGMGSPLRYDSDAGPLTGGYNSHAAVADFDGDGDQDIAVHSALGGGANNTFWGIHLYENLEHKKELGRVPFFASPQKILPIDQPVLSYDWDADRSSDLIVDGRWYRNQGKLQFDIGKPIPNFPKNVKLIFDWNRDSIPDLLASEKLQGEFWPSASVWRNGEPPYTEDGIWKGGLLRGSLRFYQGIRDSRGLRWKDCGILQAGGNPLEIYGEAYPAAADWDRDGDLDLIVGGLFDLTYFENTGDPDKPTLAVSRRIKTGNGYSLRGLYIRPVVFSLDNDPYPDLAVAQESGELSFFLCCGLSFDKTPLFNGEQRARQKNALLDVGCLSSISVADWENDGDLDIVSGNSYGELILFLNRESDGHWDQWTFDRFRVIAGANGSVQGPNEAHFGYTSPVFCDWNKDGRIDVILSDIWGKYTYFQRRESQEKSDWNFFLPESPIRCTSPLKESFVPPWVWYQPRHDELITQWRCQPAVEDWNRDGIPDLIALDSQGYLALYPGKQLTPPEVDAPQRIFLSPDGKPIRITNGLNGRSGRARFVVADWDGDGDRDIVRGCTHAGDHEDPNFAAYERVAVWYENAGDDITFVFRGSVLKNDQDVSFCGHETSPAVVDWDGNGSLDLLLGTEDGLIYFFKHEYLDGKIQ